MTLSIRWVSKDFSIFKKKIKKFQKTEKTEKHDLQISKKSKNDTLNFNFFHEKTCGNDFSRDTNIAHSRNFG